MYTYIAHIPKCLGKGLALPLHDASLGGYTPLPHVFEGHKVNMHTNLRSKRAFLRLTIHKHAEFSIIIVCKSSV